MNLKAYWSLLRWGDKEALMKLIEMYRPLLINHSMICGRFDEDLYYEQVHTMIRCVQVCEIAYIVLELS